jgi:hypothetical protein
MSQRDKSEKLDSQLAEILWRASVAEEKLKEMATAAKAEAVEAHMVLRKAVAAHAAEVASEKRQKQEEHMKAWMANVKAMLDADVARWIRTCEEQLALE